MNQKMIDQLTAKVAQDKDILEFDQALLDLAVNGWKSSIEEEVTPLNEKISSLENKLSQIKQTVCNRRGYF